MLILVCSPGDWKLFLFILRNIFNGNTIETKQSLYLNTPIRICSIYVNITRSFISQPKMKVDSEKYCKFFSKETEKRDNKFAIPPKQLALHSVIPSGTHSYSS